MEKIILTKAEEKKEIFIGKDKLFHWAPIIGSLKNGMWRDAIVFTVTIIFLFPNILYRIYMADNVGIIKLKKMLNEGWKPSTKIEEEYLIHKHILYTEKPEDDGKIWMTNGITMEEVEVINKQGFWESMRTTTIAFLKVRMWWMSLLWLISNLTGLGDFVFTTLLYTRFPRWRRNQLEKKGYEPHSDFDKNQLDKYAKKKKV